MRVSVSRLAPDRFQVVRNQAHLVGGRQTWRSRRNTSCSWPLPGQDLIGLHDSTRRASPARRRRPRADSIGFGKEVDACRSETRAEIAAHGLLVGGRVCTHGPQSTDAPIFGKLPWLVSISICRSSSCSEKCVPIVRYTPPATIRNSRNDACRRCRPRPRELRRRHWRCAPAAPSVAEPFTEPNAQCAFASTRIRRRDRRACSALKLCSQPRLPEPPPLATERLAPLPLKTKRSSLPLSACATQLAQAHASQQEP